MQCRLLAGTVCILVKWMHQVMTALMLNRLSPLSVLTDTLTQVSVTVMMMWHLRHVKVGVFLTDIGVDCCVTVAFMDRWPPDIVVQVLYAQRALVNVMHPVQDIHSKKASLVPVVWWLYWCVHEQCDKLLQGRLWLSYMSNPSTNRTAEIIQSRDHFGPRLARWIFKAATRGNRGLYRIHSSKWRQSMVRALAARKGER